MIKTLYIDTEENRINRNIHSDYYEMYTLYNALWEIPEYGIDRFKNKIISELKNNPNDPGLVFESILVVPLNQEDLMLYDFFEDNNPEQTYFYIKQEALWQAIRDYNQFDIYSKKYKRITISYDGNKVYFDLEPFETPKQEK